MTMPGETRSRHVAFSRCACGSPMSLRASERRSDIEIQIFSCSRCRRELHVLLDQEEVQTGPPITGL